jgi:hypothetical protein
VEVEVTTLFFNAAEISQQIATGLASFDFSNFFELINALEENFSKMRSSLMWAFIRNGIRVETNAEDYWYEIIIPEKPNLHNSVRANLTEEEVFRVRIHRMIIVNIYRRMANVTDVDQFLDALQDLKYQILNLHVLDGQVRQR